MLDWTERRARIEQKPGLVRPASHFIIIRQFGRANIERARRTAHAKPPVSNSVEAPFVGSEWGACKIYWLASMESLKLPVPEPW